MTLEQQAKELEKQGFDPKKEFMAYSVGKKNQNGAFLIDPIVSSRADGQENYTLRRFPVSQRKYLFEMGWQEFTPQKPAKTSKTNK